MGYLRAPEKISNCLAPTNLVCRIECSGRGEALRCAEEKPVTSWGPFVEHEGSSEQGLDGRCYGDSRSSGSAGSAAESGSVGVKALGPRPT